MKGKHGHKGHHHGKHHRAEGGGMPMKVSGNPDVFKEAEEKHKHGGKVGKKKHHGMHPEGHGSKHRHDRPRRRAGGRVGSDKSPLSSAHHGGKAGEMHAGEPD